MEILTIEQRSSLELIGAQNREAPVPMCDIGVVGAAATPHPSPMRAAAFATLDFYRVDLLSALVIWAQ